MKYSLYIGSKKYFLSSEDKVLNMSLENFAN